MEDRKIRQGNCKTLNQKGLSKMRDTRGEWHLSREGTSELQRTGREKTSFILDLRARERKDYEKNMARTLDCKKAKNDTPSQAHPASDVLE